MIEPSLGGVISYCRPENKVALGCVEGLNNTDLASFSARPMASTMNRTWP